MSKPAHKQDDPAKKPGQIQYGLALESGEFIPADQLPIRGQAKYLRDVIGRIQQEEQEKPKLTFEQWYAKHSKELPIWWQRNDVPARMIWQHAQENK